MVNFARNKAARQNEEDVQDVEEEEEVGEASRASMATKAKVKEVGTEEVLDCGKPLIFTFYDHLIGIQNRAGHPYILEPKMALTFKNGLFTIPL